MMLELVDKLFLVYTFMLLGRILGSWIPELQNTRFMQFLAYYTDPYLNIFRKIIPPLGMFDLSPIVAFLCLNVVEQLVKTLLVSLLL